MNAVRGLRAGLALLWSLLDTLLRWLAQPRVRRVVAGILTLLTGAGLAALVWTNWDALREAKWEFHPAALVVSFIFYTAALGLAILAWGQIMNAFGGYAPWSHHVRAYCVSNLARRLPGVLMHVAGRMILYDYRDENKAAIPAASGLELLLSGLSGILIAIAAWPRSVGRFLHPAWIVGLLVVCVIVVEGRVLNALVRRLGVRQDLYGPLTYRRSLSWLLILGIDWILGGMVLFALIQTVSPVSPTLLLPVIGAWCLSGTVALVGALLPVGFALRELTLALLLVEFLPSQIAVVIPILARVVLTVYELLWALPAYFISANDSAKSEVPPK